MVDGVNLHEAIVTGAADGIRVKVGFHLCNGECQGIRHAILLTAVLHGFLEVIA